MRRGLWIELVLFAWCVGCLFSVGCGPKNGPIGIPLAIGYTESPPPPPAPPTATSATIRGTVLFEKLVLSPAPTQTFQNQLTPSFVLKPLRAADVLAVDSATFAPLAGSSGTTDDTGTFAIQVPPKTSYFLVVLTSTSGSGGRANLEVRDNVVTTASGRIYAFAYSTQPIGQPLVAGTDTTFSLPPILHNSGFQFGNGPLASQPADARPLNILDAALTASDKVRAASAGAALRKLTLCWDGFNSTVGSFFLPTGAPDGGPIVVVRGGSSSADDTDEYDDSVIAHEYGHFVVNELSRDVSLGGQHSFNTQLYPTLAYSEGVADWFSAAVLGSPFYVDARRYTGQVPAAFAFNFETRNTDIDATTGPTSEFSTAEILWDLIDGDPAGPADADNDPAKTYLFADVLDALKSLKNSTSYIIIDDVLAAFTAGSAQRQADVTGVLAVPPGQANTAAAVDQFPLAVPVPSVTLNNTCTTIDVLTTNGVTVNLKDSGLDDANRFFRFDLFAPATVNVTSTLQAPGLGTDADGTNLDLFLFDSTPKLITASQTATPIEHVTANLPAGRYYVLVSGRPDPGRDVGTNTRSSTAVFDLAISAP